ncbi:MAG: hypothetical protein IPH44_21730 [Myxococcales bacterium]|nr:hypothetical protein [Myxococcales bacterium]MBK7191980.1 hypothetical protein [Myxococcales bacterium]
MMLNTGGNRGRVAWGGWFLHGAIMLATAALTTCDGSKPPRQELPDGCYMNGATTKDGELALLALSLHHSRSDRLRPGSLVDGAALRGG